MRIEDLTIEVRDKTLKRVGKVPSSMVKLTATPVHNGVGSWSLTLPAEHALAAALRVPGAGVIITGPTDVIASGPTTSPSLTAGADDPEGLVTVSGLTDDVLLADALAWPQPSNANVATQSAGYDNRAGVAETVMRAYVNANIGPGAPAARRGLLAQRLTLAANLGRGPTVVKSARFPTLGELLSEIAAYAGLGFRIVQRGDVLVFEVYEVTDRTKFIRLDIHNGGLSSQTVEVSPPGVTRAIVAGQGKAAERTLLSRSTTDSTAAEGAWGRRIEVFKDQRNTDDLTELQQAGDEILADKGFTATNVKAIPAESTTMLYGWDYREGDRVTVVVEGQETTSTVTQATIMADSDGVLVGVGIGDVSGFDAASAQARRVDDTAKRVSELERNVESGLPAYDPDTDWVAVAPVAGMTSTMRVRRRSGTIQTSGTFNAVASGSQAANVFMPLGYIPEGFRPDAGLLLGGSATVSQPVQYQLNATSGLLQVRANNVALVYPAASNFSIAGSSW